MTDNPYVSVKGYHLSKGLKLNATEDYELEKCKKEDLDKLIDEEKQEWYLSAVCFKNRDAVEAKGNWFMEEYDLPVIVFEKCNSTERVCKTDAEINDFIADNPFFFVHQEMVM